MSTFTTPITLTATVDQVTNLDPYTGGDLPGSTYQTFEVGLTLISEQGHTDQTTRDPGKYNGLDIQTGMYISDAMGNTIVKIISISDKTETEMTCIAEDVDMMSLRLHGDNVISGNVTLFATNPEGVPTILPNNNLNIGALSSIQSRFSQNETDDRLRFEHDVVPFVDVGDIVTVNEDGDLVKFGSSGTPGVSDISVGVVVGKANGDKDIFVKPFNDVITDYQNPEALDGNPTDIYYTDPNNSGSITTTQSAGSSATFMHLNKAIATVQNVTKTTVPTNNDLIEINGIIVFNGPGGDPVPADLQAWAGHINVFSAQTNVEATVAPVPAVVDPEGLDSINLAFNDLLPGNDIFIPLYEVSGGPPTNWPTMSISDGTNTINIEFNDNLGIPNVNFQVVDIFGISYAVYLPEQIELIIQNAIDNANPNLDLEVELYNSIHDGEAIRITTTGSATGITLENIHPAIDNDDYNLVGGPDGAGSILGLPSGTTNLGPDQLTLTRQSGGPINISGEPVSLGYINTGGFVSSNNGRIPYLLLIESSGTATGSGVGYPGNSDQNPDPSSGDNSDTGLQITKTPFPGSNVLVTVNGVGVNVGDGTPNEDCYFASPEGDIRQISEIKAGDQLYWNADIAGFELEGNDDIDIIYDVSTRDL